MALVRQEYLILTSFKILSQDRTMMADTKVGVRLVVLDRALDSVLVLIDNTTTAICKASDLEDYCKLVMGKGNEDWLICETEELIKRVNKNILQLQKTYIVKTEVTNNSVVAIYEGPR